MGPKILAIPQMELAREALKDYDYDWAKLNITSEGEELLLQMQMDGKPAKTLPFVYRKDIGGFMKVEANAKGSKFQGIRWMIADMATEIEAARLMTFAAAEMKDRGENYTAQASMAKLFASEMVNRTTAKALQMHGGYGFTKEYPVERYFRDARVFTIYEGTSEIQRVVISNQIFKDKRKP